MKEIEGMHEEKILLLGDCGMNVVAREMKSCNHVGLDIVLVDLLRGIGSTESKGSVIEMVVGQDSYKLSRVGG